MAPLLFASRCAGMPPDATARFSWIARGQGYLTSATLRSAAGEWRVRSGFQLLDGSLLDNTQSLGIGSDRSWLAPGAWFGADIDDCFVLKVMCSQGERWVCAGQRG